MNRDQAVLDAVANQRNNALNESVSLAADLAVAQARIAELEAQVESLKPAEAPKE